MWALPEIQIQKFTNYIMQDGKRFLAQNLLEQTFDILQEKGYKDPKDIFEKAFENIMPRIEVRPKRVGGSIFQVPQEVKPERRFALASRWILAVVRKKSGVDFSKKLAQEIIDASQETGEAYKKKLEVYKMAEANKAFARFARK